MSWDKEFILWRVEDGKGSVVYGAEALKDAKYWLSYVALPKDAIFRTPKHRQYKGSGAPEYLAHLIERGKVAYDSAEWKKLFDGAPPEPDSAPE